MQNVKQRNKVSICIPAYNNEKTISETLDSCCRQDYPLLEILVCDDCSTDKTRQIVSDFKNVLLYPGSKNVGIGKNIEECIRRATGDIIVFMCADDLFTSNKVISDIVDRFRNNPNLGYVGRWYYQFMNGYPGAIRVHRSMDPYFQADNPSGLAFRRAALNSNNTDVVEVSSHIFVEAASIVKKVLHDGWSWQIIQYDTIAVRVHPGGNTATKAFYYNDSPTLSWIRIIGENKNHLTAFVSFIQLKNWARYRDLLREIWLFAVIRPVNLLRPDFWIYALIALVIPRSILRPFTNFYKHRICRMFVKIVERPL